MARHQGHRRAARERDRRVRAGRRRPGLATASSSSCRASPTPMRSASSSARPAGSTSCPLGQTQVARRARSSTSRQYPPLFSGDQVKTATRRPRTRTAGLTVDFVLKDEGAKLFADYTADARRRLLRDRPRRRGHLGAGHPELDPERPGPDHGRRARRLHRRRTRTTSSRSSSSARCRSRSRSCRASRSARRSASQFLDQSLLAGPHRDRARHHLHAHLLPAAGPRRELRAHLLHARRLAIFRLIPVTLTLAGIAGFVLSVGMAVDANILIFERMKEELRLGKSLPAAVEAGFNRAWNSILDSNVSSLITATILYSFGSSVDPRLRPRPDHRRARLDVQRDRRHPLDPALGRPPGLGAQAVAVRDARGRVRRPGRRAGPSPGARRATRV